METGRYRHYKGGEYQVFDFATNENNGVEMALYIDVATGKNWVRPTSEFTDRIEGVLRFEKIAYTGKKAVATLHSKVKFCCRTMQDAFNNGVNGMAVQALAESLGDKDKLIEGGIMFIYPYDHKKRPVWVIVTGEAPFVASVDDSPKTGELMETEC